MIMMMSDLYKIFIYCKCRQINQINQSTMIVGEIDRNEWCWWRVEEKKGRKFIIY